MADAREANSQSENSDDALRVEIETRPSTLPDIRIELRGFPTEQEAQAVSQAIGSYLHLFGKLLNLKRLSRVIVAYDYDGALRDLDRGTGNTEALTPTRDEVAVGIAMTPAIVENGEPHSVMVLNANYMIVFAQAEKPDLNQYQQRMVHALAHECAHVHDLDAQAVAFPNAILKLKLTAKDGILFRIAAGCWDEYIASRLSAFMGQDFTMTDLEEAFCAALETAKPRADIAIRQYRMDGDLPRVIQEVTEYYKRALVYASYLLGHLDGLGYAIDERAPKAFELVKRTSYFEPFFVKLSNELRSMYETYNHWEAIEIFEPLKQIGDELLEIGGLRLQQRVEGMHVAIPFTEETTPSIQEQVEFNLSRRVREIPT